MSPPRIISSGDFWTLLAPYMQGFDPHQVLKIDIVIGARETPVEVLMTQFVEEARQTVGRKFRLYAPGETPVMTDRFLGELQRNFPYLKEESLHVTRCILHLEGKRSLATMRVSLDFETEIALDREAVLFSHPYTLVEEAA